MPWRFSPFRIFLPVALGYAAAATAFGALATALHVGLWMTLGMSAVLYSGALQSTVLGVMVLNPPFGLLLAVAFGVNMRHMLYGPHLETHRQGHWRRIDRWLTAGFLTDELYALGLDDRLSPETWTSIGLGLYVSWILGTAVGAWGAGQVPHAWLASFGLALPSLFVALLIPRLRARPEAAGAVSALLLALIGRFMDWPEVYYLVPILGGATIAYLYSPKSREN
jgi:predicted branched-subunit amino acid permease